jgi:hypothetical protein
MPFYTHRWVTGFTSGGPSPLLRIAPWLCAVLILQLCTGFTTAQQTLIPEQSLTPTPQPSPSATSTPRQSETATPTPQQSESSTPTPTPQESEAPTPEQSIPALHPSPVVEKGPHDALRTESVVSKDKEKEAEFLILIWTLIVTAIGVIITAIGVMAGLIALFYARATIREAQKQARENATVSRAQFWILLREVFTAYDDIHANFRPGGPWHKAIDLPSTPADFARTELCMGLLEYCDRMLEEELIDEKAFGHAYSYRLNNLLTNKWVVKEKLQLRRYGWLGFINLCYRFPTVAKPDLVDKLKPEEYSKLYPKREGST